MKLFPSSQGYMGSKVRIQIWFSDIKYSVDKMLFQKRKMKCLQVAFHVITKILILVSIDAKIIVACILFHATQLSLQKTKALTLTCCWECWQLTAFSTHEAQLRKVTKPKSLQYYKGSPSAIPNLW